MGYRALFFVRTRTQGIMQQICNKIALSDTVVPSRAPTLPTSKVRSHNAAHLQTKWR